MQTLNIIAQISTSEHVTVLIPFNLLEMCRSRAVNERLTCTFISPEKLPQKPQMTDCHAAQ